VEWVIDYTVKKDNGECEEREGRVDGKNVAEAIDNFQATTWVKNYVIWNVGMITDTSAPEEVFKEEEEDYLEEYKRLYVYDYRIVFKDGSTSEHLSVNADFEKPQTVRALNILDAAREASEHLKTLIDELPENAKFAEVSEICLVE